MNLSEEVIKILSEENPMKSDGFLSVDVLREKLKNKYAGALLILKVLDCLQLLERQRLIETRTSPLDGTFAARLK